MAKQDNFFRVHGAKEVADALMGLARGTQNKIVRPGLRQAIAEVRKVAKTLSPRDDGHLRKAIQSKVITAKGVKSKGVVGKIGILKKTFTDENGVPVMEYAGGPKGIIKTSGFLERANVQAKPAAIQKLTSVTKQKLAKWQADMDAKSKAAAAQGKR